MLVEVIKQNSYEFEPTTGGHLSELDLRAADADTPHTFKAVHGVFSPVDQLHVAEGDLLDIHGAISYRADRFLVAHVYRARQTA